MLYIIVLYESQNLIGRYLRIVKFADDLEAQNHAGARVHMELPREQVLNSHEWDTIKNFFIHFFGEYEFRKTWSELCEYYEDEEGTDLDRVLVVKRVI